MPNFLKKKMGNFKPIEKKWGKCVKKCQSVMVALHTIATMLPKTHCAKPAYTKIAYKKYIFKIAYSKLASFNSNLQNEGATLKEKLALWKAVFE